MTECVIRCLLFWSSDGSTQALGTCLRDFRNKPYPVRAKITYYKQTLTVGETRVITQETKIKFHLITTKHFSVNGVNLITYLYHIMFADQLSQWYDNISDLIHVIQTACSFWIFQIRLYFKCSIIWLRHVGNADFIWVLGKAAGSD